MSSTAVLTSFLHVLHILALFPVCITIFFSPGKWDDPTDPSVLKVARTACKGKTFSGN